jgi:hypothetical protein
MSKKIDQQVDDFWLGFEQPAIRQICELILAWKYLPVANNE